MLVVVVVALGRGFSVVAVVLDGRTVAARTCGRGATVVGGTVDVVVEVAFAAATAFQITTSLPSPALGAWNGTLARPASTATVEPCPPP